MSSFKKKTKEELLIEIDRIQEENVLLKDKRFDNSIWIENSPVCTKIIDLDFNLLYMSSSGVKDLKIDDITEYYGKPYPLSFYPDSFKTLMTENLKLAKESGQTITQEAPIQDINGNTLWFQSTIVPIYDEQNKLDHIMIVSLQSTDHKIARERLKESEELLNETGKLGKIGGWELDLVTNTPTLTKETFNIYELSADEIPSIKDGIKYYAPEAQPVIKEAVKKAIDEGIPYDLELPFITAKGRNIWVRAVGQVEKENGKATRLYGILMDITERVERDIKLKESESLLKTAEFLSDQGAWKWDIVNDSWTFSENWLRIHGYNQSDITQEELMKIAHPDDVAIISKAFNDALNGIKPYNIEHRVVRQSDNEIRIIHASAECFFNEKGKPETMVGIARDITEQKEAETELRKSEERFTLAMKATSDGLFDWNLETNDIYYSPGWKKMIGYEDHELPNDFSVWETTTDPEDVKKSWELQQKLISREVDRFELEFKMKHKEGHWIDILSRAEAVFNNKGKAVRIVGTHLDVTERNNTFRKLKEADSKLQDTFNLSPSIIAKVDLFKGFFVEVNAAITRILGYQIEEFLNRPLTELIHPDDIIKTQQEVEDKINEGVSSFENRYLCKDGTYKWIAWQGSPADENGIVTAIGSDISIRKNAEERTEGLNHIIEDSLNEIYVFDLETLNFIYTNRAAQQNIGYSAEEMYSMTPLDIKPEFSLELFEEMISPLKEGKEKKIIFETIHQRKIKSSYNVEVHLQLTQFDSKPAYVAMILDITEKKKAENEIIEAKEKAEESDRLKSAFLSNMSHEIRTPMNGILGFTDLLKEPQLDSHKKDKYISIIEKSGERMLSTINDIIDISRIEANQVEVIKTEISVNKILEELHDFFQSEAEKKGIDLIYKPILLDTNARVATDKHKLEGILTNLIKNAIKYTNQGHIEFGFSLKEEEGEERLLFYVKDTGIGIPADRLDAIFNRFEQADIEDTGVYQGSGLGLAISKSYVEMLGGNISVSSEEGSGSTFTFTIPYSKTSVIERQVKEDVIKDQLKSLSNLSVIVAEDDETSIMFFETVFEDIFKSIIYTSKGTDTVKKCRENPDTDIILMDIKMPDMHGYDATREIRKFNKDVIIIAQTAYGLAGDREKAIDAGCNDYITKPLNKKSLLEKMETCLDK